MLIVIYFLFIVITYVLFVIDLVTIVLHKYKFVLTESLAVL